MPSLPPGFRFHPTDVELVVYYLKRKVMGKSFRLDAISEIELYKFAPWDLPEKSLLHSRDREWYFFCPRDRKYANSNRTNRATDTGYWKSTGKDKPIVHSSRTIGLKKSLVYHQGKAPKGDRTDWVMHEYRLVDSQFADTGYPQDAYVLCKVFLKSGLGPKIGEQYGAPFNEEEWEDDITEGIISPLHLACPSLLLLDGPSVMSNALKEPPVTSGGADVSLNPDPDLSYADGMWLDELAELLSASPEEYDGMRKMADSEVLCKAVASTSTNEPLGIYDGLEDLSSPMSRNTGYYEGMAYEHPILTEVGDEQFLELNDFLDHEENDLCKLLDPFGQHSAVQDPNYACVSDSHELVCHHDGIVSAASDDCHGPSSSVVTCQDFH